VWDDTHAFTGPAKSRLAGALRHFKEERGCEFWVCAMTFVPDSQSVRTYARQLRQAWSGDADAILLAYDRVGGQSLSLSPSLWNRYPSAAIVALMQEGAKIMNHDEIPLDQRLEQSAVLTMQRVRQWEVQHRAMEQNLPDAQRGMAGVYSAGLGAVSLVVLLICGAARRRERAALNPRSFPAVRVATRLGAPCGGGVIVEL
jgi:hypothetical protein